ncbi:MAG: hypothetical protein KC443_04785 [Anaerolineales bacterium]|nr:hypothetical protein [Anaerolineales bacterium]
MVTLQVYVAADCWSCQETRRLVADMQLLFPDVSFELLDTAQTPLPDYVFAVPTYVLNGRVISLGNPTRAVLAQKLAAAQA